MKGAAIAGIACLVFATSAAAQEVYFGVSGGAFIPNRLSFSATGTAAGLPVTASGQISANTGPHVGGIAGYRLNDAVSVELNADYVSTDFSGLKGNLSLRGIGSTGGSFDLTGHADLFAGYINGVITPFGAGITPFGQGAVLTPYLGAGPGLVYANVAVDSLGVAGFNAPVGASTSGADFTADVVLGVAAQIAPQWQLGLSYRYLWFFTKAASSGSGVNTNIGSVSGQTVGLELRFRS